MGRSGKPGIGEVWPVGMGFRPRDDELFNHHLKRKLRGLQENCRVIPELDIYQWEPQALFEKYDEMSDLPSEGRECFFYCVRNGNNRMTRTGYWKETSEKRIVNGRDGKPIRSKKILVYKEGRQPNGSKSPFSMHEYHLNCHFKPKIKGSMMEIVLCRIINKEFKETNLDSPSSESIEPDPIASGGGAIANQGDNETSTQVSARSNLTEAEVEMPSYENGDAEMEPLQNNELLWDEFEQFSYNGQFEVGESSTVNFNDYGPDDGISFSDLWG